MKTMNGDDNNNNLETADALANALNNDERVNLSIEDKDERAYHASYQWARIIRWHPAHDYKATKALNLIFDSQGLQYATKDGRYVRYLEDECRWVATDVPMLAPKNLDPRSEDYDVDEVSYRLDEVCGMVYDIMKSQGFILPDKFNSTNIKNSLWELIGDPNIGARIESFHKKLLLESEKPE